MDYITQQNETRSNAEQSETSGDLRVSYVSEKERRFQQARRGGPPISGKHLYFIKIARGRSPVKVGRANDPFERLKNLQVGSPYELKLLGVLDNCGEDEFEFHQALSGHRIRGEWFSWSKHVEITIRLAIDGGDWRSAKDPDRRQMDDKWWVDSPLYADAPKLLKEHPHG